MEKIKNLEVWFVTGSQHLYGPETLKQVALDAKEIAKGLEEANKFPVTIVWKDTVKTPDEIYKMALDANHDEKCIGLITWMHTFSPAKMWIAGLTNLKKPFVQFHTQYNRDIPWDSIDMDFMNLNQTAHGGREFGFIASRLRIESKVVVGYWNEERVLYELDAWIRAAAAWADSKQLKVARFGDNMRQVAVTEGDKVEAQIKFGYEVNGYAMGDLTKYLDMITDEELDAILKEYEECYVMCDSLKANGARRDSVVDAAKIELAMTKFLEEGGFKAFTTTFENLQGLKQLPGLAVQRLMEKGYGFGGEGDWKTSALVRAMKVMSFGLESGTSFMEDYTYHMEPGRQIVLGAHMLEVCPTIGKGQVSLEVHPLGIGGKEDPARLVFNAPVGAAVNASIMDMGSRFRMVINEVVAVDPIAALPKLPVARVCWEAMPNLPVAAAAWIYAGGAHHTGFSQAIGTEHLRNFAAMADIEVVVIDKDTNLNQFKNELKWNDLYYHLAKGL